MAFGVSEVLSGILCYMLDADRLLPVLTEGSAWLVFGGVLYAHLTYLVAVPAARLMRWAGSVTAVLAALVVITSYSIHYTKLYEGAARGLDRHAQPAGPEHWLTGSLRERRLGCR